MRICLVGKGQLLMQHACAAALKTLPRECEAGRHARAGETDDFNAAAERSRNVAATASIASGVKAAFGVATLIALLALACDASLQESMKRGDLLQAVRMFSSTAGVTALQRFVTETMLPFTVSAAVSLSLCWVLFVIARMIFGVDSFTLELTAFFFVKELISDRIPEFTGAGVLASALAMLSINYMSHCRDAWNRGDSWFRVVFVSAADVALDSWRPITGALRYAAERFLKWDFRTEAQRKRERVLQSLEQTGIEADDEFKCPITKSLFVQPVVVHGHILERDVVEEMLRRGLNKHPVTYERFSTTDLVPAPVEFLELLREYTAKKTGAPQHSVPERDETFPE